MAAEIYYSPFIPTFNGNGLPVANAVLTFFYTGTTDLAPIYQDSAMTIPMVNPVISDGAARYPNIYMPEEIVYRVRETGPDGTPLAADIDPYVPGQVATVVPDLPEFAAPDGSSLVGFLQAGTGATARTVQAKCRDTLSVKDFGAVGDGVANDSAAFALATTESIASGKTLEIPGGTYKLGSTWTAITTSFQRVIALGKVILHFTGAGVAVKIDGGVATACYDTVFGGDIPIQIKGNALCTDALYSRANHHSRINVHCRDCVTGVRVVWNVCTDLRVTVSVNEGAFVLTPTNGLLMEKRGVGEYVAACNIYPIIEGVSGSGIKGAVDGAGLNNIWGGTSEANAAGLEWSAGCNYNAVFGTDLELNTGQDIYDSGKGNNYHNLQAKSSGSGPSVDMITAQGASFHGCTLLRINLQVTSRDTSLYGCGLSDNVSLGITGTGTRKVFGCHEFDVNGDITATLPDVLGASTAWTPTLTQGVAVAATIAGATYVDNAGIINMIGQITATAAGTAANNIVIGGIPPAAIPLNYGTYPVLGHAFVLDAGTTVYLGAVIRLSDTTAAIQISGNGNYLGVAPAMILANTDVISLQLNYRRG